MFLEQPLCLRQKAWFIAVSNSRAPASYYYYYFILNPLDLIEDVVVSNDWPHNRPDNDTLYVEVAGEWCDYQLTLAWSNDKKLLQYTWTYNIKVPFKKHNSLYALLNKINFFYVKYLYKRLF